MRIFFLIALLFFHSNCFGQSISSQTENSIDSIFKSYDEGNSPGFAIGVIKENKILYNKGFGLANLDYKIPISSESAFSIASVSKQFTAACIALLIIEGKLSLETPVSDFVPSLKKYRDTIKVKHLIYNTSGITDCYKLKRPNGISWITFNYFDIDYCIDVSLQSDTLAFIPETKWDYTNVNYMLLTKIVEKVSGLPFREFAKKKLFDPLGMNSTFIHDDITKVIENRVTPYNPRSKPYVEAYRNEGIFVSNEGQWIQHHRNTPHYGGSGVVTTMNDLLKWSQNFFTKEFGGDAFYNLMHTTGIFKHGKNNQAFGLHLDKYKGRDVFSWDGGDYGISTQIIRFPKQKVAIIILSNMGNGRAFEKANKVAEIMIENGEL
ncbi:serine hydrolase domain-containing protein [Bernardetia sp.]|uniref:serine hydrolase domain-containing protein n=1 Tax=Bernardetia sp. TaxID=1937974 RepID=UPI0025C09384|nr:serine hydrolase domain-containing protein [Bernardetia sp.]